MLFARTAARRFTSQYGPKLKSQPHIKGFPLVALKSYLPMAAGMGAAAGIALVFLAEEIPPMRVDVLQKIPVVGWYWKKEIAPEDNPF